MKTPEASEYYSVTIALGISPFQSGEDGNLGIETGIESPALSSTSREGKAILASPLMAIQGKQRSEKAGDCRCWK